MVSKTLKHVTHQLAQLDPRRDHHQMVFLLNCYALPWDMERAMEFALLRTYAVPSISTLLMRTGEFSQRPRKRYDDTELIMYELIEHGYDSDRGRRALKRMNQMHGRFAISNDDMLYVLSTFVFEPSRWMEKYGWRSLTPNEKLALFYFYTEVGKRMGIQNIPTEYEAYEQFNQTYEREKFQFAASNHTLGQATTNLLLSFYLPRFLWFLARPLVYALLDQPLLNAVGFPQPPQILRGAIAVTLKLRAVCLRWLPERHSSVLGTQRKRATYPKGYEIEKLGTFPNPDPTEV